MKDVTIPVVHTSVFGLTSRGGNPCPVVFDADKLSSEQMQHLAADFAVETAFILSPTQPNADIRLRFFVPQHEMEMCGHATVGTVSVLVAQHHLTTSPVNIETPLGIITVEWELQQNDVRVSVEQFPPVFIPKNPTSKEVASALGISEKAIATELGPIQSVSTSRPKLMVPLQNQEILNGLEPDFEYLWTICDHYQTTGFYPFSVQSRNGKSHIQARQFPKRAGYNEDPATGVAACALGAYLTEHRIFGAITEGWLHYEIEQGHAMGRPSIIQASSYVEGDQIRRTRISGQAKILSEEAVSVHTSRCI
jgi:PhzF family phenazine biosynthesis protein